MARRNNHRIMGGVFLVMGLLMALVALSEAVQGFGDGVSAMFLFPAILAGLFFVGGAYLLVSARIKRRGRS
ncbi:MAG TPA: hypothetical protein VGN57_20260 [Pirellulaceae bacterium]|jgi:hypothetical protein|nr:hypothetical protein [Pirellulaceae bacterium]